MKREYVLGRAGLANISIAAAIGLSMLFGIGMRALDFLVERPLMRTLSWPQPQLLQLFVGYWLVALLIYLVLRAARAESRLSTRRSIQRMFLVANALVLLYVAARMMAAGVEGGGGSFVVMSLGGPFLLLPSRVLLAAAFVWLVARSIARPTARGALGSVSTSEALTVAIAIAVPAVHVARLNIGEEAPFAMARRAASLFAARCTDAGERFLKAPKEPINGVYFERPGTDRYERVDSNGVYQARTSHSLSMALVDQGFLLFAEQPAARGSRDDTATQVRRHRLGDWQGELVTDVQSDAAVRYSDLHSTDDVKLGIRGTKVSIEDLRSGETLATTTYFVSSRQQRICGATPNGAFDAVRFVIQALGLEKRYLSASEVKRE